MAQERVQRRLAAILAADAVGYSRLVGLDEEGTIARLKALREELIDPGIAQHQGRIVKTTGDGILVEFSSVVDAVRSAVAVQRMLTEREAGVPEDRRIRFRIGVNLGDIVIDGDDILGDGVNVAARLEELAEPGGVCVSGTVHEHVAGKLDLGFEDLGEQRVKNIAKPVRVYRVRPAATAAPEFSAPVPGFAGRPAIAVLPFENMSGDSDQDYFADGITEDIITAMASWRWFPVIARNSAFTFKGKAEPVGEIARQLGVRYVVEGSVRKSGNRVRITAQLIDCATGHHVWADRYDRNLEDVFALQDEITERVVGAIEPEILQAEVERATRRPPSDMDAWDLHMRAMSHYYAYTKVDSAKAIELNEKAAAADPTFSMPHYGLAACHIERFFTRWSDSPSDALQAAREAARKAVELDPKDSHAHTMLGHALLYGGEHEKAIAEQRLALDLNPSGVFAHYGLGLALALSGRAEEGIMEVELALRIDPRGPKLFHVYTGAALANFHAGRYEEAVERAKKSIQLEPRYFETYRFLAASLGHLGRLDEAREALEEARRLMPRLSLAATRKRYAASNPAEVERMVEGLRQAGLPEE